VIGDVCGKGPEAAALTSVMRDTLRAAALRDDGPSEALSLLNAAILNAGEGRFCTASCARLELGARTRLTVCNGGHPPPLVLRKEGGVEPIGPPGTLLGIYDDIDFVETSVALKKGDLVMLYTDGLFDVSPGLRSRVEPVEQVLARCKGMSADEVATAIEASAVEGQRGEPQDDMAILVLRRV
jgi:sigma-B regulation protein RsbU (phosphoserine phosphatase)